MEDFISYRSAVELGIIHEIKSIHAKYPHLFKGIGLLKEKVKLHINPHVPTVAQPHRRIPFHMRKKVEQEIERLTRLDIIEEVSGPTTWVSPIVGIPKSNDEIRICVDLRRTNEAITPTL